MANKIPSFITGASAKIKIGAKTMAYAQDVSYNVTVTTIPIETMGRYEVVSNEPVAYFVDGTLSIVRYTAEASIEGMQSAAAGGNGVDQWAGGFNPGVLISSGTFDLEIMQKSTHVGTGFVPATPTTPATPGAVTTTSVMKLIDCRLTRMGGAINKRGILVEQFSFNAILAESAGNAVSNSGDQDLA